MSKTKKPPVARAVATIKTPMVTDALKVSVTNSISQAMQQSPDWAAATDVQNAVKAWSKEASTIDANTKAIANLRAQLKAAEAAQLAARRDWQAAKRQVLSNVTVYCGGDVDKVKGFTLDVVSYDRLGALAAPADVTVNPGKVTGEAVSSWEKGIATHGFVVQHATDPTNAATISAQIPCTKSKFTLDGLPQGANVSFRVAAIDPVSPTGQRPWAVEPEDSAWRAFPRVSSARRLSGMALYGT
jgi:hypothetical protein